METMTEASPSVSVQDVVQVASIVVSCDGRNHDDQLGHPRIYLNMGEEGRVACPYCSRQFVLVDHCEFKG
jgi:uncharacterized Zn-finger protein